MVAMVDSMRRGLAALLLVGAVVLGVVAFAMWSKANDRAATQNRSNGYETAIDGSTFDNVKPVHTGSLVCAGGAAVAFLGAVIFLASTPPQRDQSPTPGE